MPRTRRVVTLTWRDEDYGSLCGVKAAFRLLGTVAFSDSAVARIHQAARKAGFSFHHGRCSWVAYDLRAAHALTAALEALRYEVRHEGRWTAPPTIEEVAT